MDGRPVDHGSGVEEWVVAILEDVGGFPPGLITPETRFHEAIGADSLDDRMFVLRCEDEFGVTIEDDDLEAFRTVGQLAQYIKDRIQ